MGEEVTVMQVLRDREGQDYEDLPGVNEWTSLVP